VLPTIGPGQNGRFVASVDLKSGRGIQVTATYEAGHSCRRRSISAIAGVGSLVVSATIRRAGENFIEWLEILELRQIDFHRRIGYFVRAMGSFAQPAHDLALIGATLDIERTHAKLGLGYLGPLVAMSKGRVNFLLEALGYRAWAFSLRRQACAPQLVRSFFELAGRRISRRRG
jgi:hypothetical protein